MEFSPEFGESCNEALLAISRVDKSVPSRIFGERDPLNLLLRDEIPPRVILKVAKISVRRKQALSLKCSLPDAYSTDQKMKAEEEHDRVKFFRSGKMLNTKYRIDSSDSSLNNRILFYLHLDRSSPWKCCSKQEQKETNSPPLSKFEIKFYFIVVVVQANSPFTDGGAGYHL